MSDDSSDQVVTCRLTSHGDVRATDALVALFLEMEVHYWGAADAPPADATERYVRSQILAPDSPCELAVAERGGRIVAFATFGILHPGADSGGTLYLKDLYTTAAARDVGVGRRLMEFLAREAVARGCTRLDWTTWDANTGARSFYERLGAKQVENKVYYRLNGDALRALAACD